MIGSVGESGHKSAWALSISMLALTFTNFYWFPGNILSWDVFGYYLYLPLTFIHHNLDLHDVEMLQSIVEKYQSSSTLYQAYATENGNWVLRYPMGLAILYLPFFLLGHLFALVAGYEADGFSLPYQSAILTAGVAYTCAGLFVLRLALKRYFNDTIVAVTLITIVFGTNYFWHAGFHGSNAMSHNYLFTLYAWLIFLTIRLYEKFNLFRALPVAVIATLIMLCRPSEIVCLFIPVFWGVASMNDIKVRWHQWSTNIKVLLPVVSVGILLGSLQLFYWKWITGSFLFYSYGDNHGEGFQFFEPNLLEVLFSYRKGWLLYTPVMAFSIIGMLYILKRRMEFGIPVLLYFLVNLYIVASWSCWWYAESFSQRSLVQSYALLAFPLGLFYTIHLQHHRKAVSWIVGVLAMLLVTFNLFQTWQFKNGLIHASRMTNQAYWSNFLSVAASPDYEKLLMLDRDGFDPESYSLDGYRLTQVLNAPIGDQSDSIDTAVRGQKITGPDVYSKGIEIEVGDLMKKDHAIVKVKMKITVPDTVAFAGALVCATYHAGWSYGYKSVDLEKSGLKPSVAQVVSYSYLTPVVRSKHDTFKVYYWNRCQKGVVVDYLGAEIWERNP